MQYTKKNYIQVDDLFFKVTLVDGKPVLTEVKPDEVVSWEVEQMCLLDGSEAMSASLLQEIIDKVQVDLSEGLESSLKNLIIHALGMNRNSDDKFWISGFNDNNSAVVRHLASKLEQRLKEADLNRDLDLTDLEKKNMRAAMKKSFKDMYERNVSQMVYKAAENLASQHVNEIIHELTETKLKTVCSELLARAIRK